MLGWAEEFHFYFFFPLDNPLSSKASNPGSIADGFVRFGSTRLETSALVASSSFFASSAFFFSTFAAKAAASDALRAKGSPC